MQVLGTVSKQSNQLHTVLPTELIALRKLQFAGAGPQFDIFNDFDNELDVEELSILMQEMYLVHSHDNFIGYITSVLVKVRTMFVLGHAHKLSFVK